ncbi:MAG: hypothetical protein ABI347_03410 [Nitrososphaera sp.]|jgi:hypothetical protein
MKLETSIAAASLGLSVMFVVLLLSFYNFLIGPEGRGPDRVVDPPALLIQEVFISAAPSVILAGVAFALTRTVGNKPVGLLLIGAGIIMIAGMVASTGMLAKIPEQFTAGGISVVPYIFMGAGAGVAAAGAYLTVVSKKTRMAGNLDDLR